MTTDKLDIATRVSCTSCGTEFASVAVSVEHQCSTLGIAKNLFGRMATAVDLIETVHRQCGTQGFQCPTELHEYIPTAEDDADTIERIINKNADFSVNAVLSQICARWDTKRYAAAYDIWEDKY